MIRRLAIFLIRIYQVLVSPLLGPSCRFTPSCSSYTTICIERFGILRGCYLGSRRLVKCHPWGACGYDPPPSEIRSIATPLKDKM